MRRLGFFYHSGSGLPISIPPSFLPTSGHLRIIIQNTWCHGTRRPPANASRPGRVWFSETRRDWFRSVARFPFAPKPSEHDRRHTHPLLR